MLALRHVNTISTPRAVHLLPRANRMRSPNTHSNSRQNNIDGPLLSTILFLLAVGAFSSGMSMRLMDPMLPFIAREFDISLGEAGQTITWFSVAYGISLLFVGAVGDRYNKLWVTAAACVICALTALACALAPDFLFLRAGRLFSGAASSAVMTLAMAWIGDTVSYTRRQSVLSRILIGMSLGVSAGILVGGFAADERVDWRTVFVVLAFCYLLIGLALLFLLRRHPQLLHKREEIGVSPNVSTTSPTDTPRQGLNLASARPLFFSVFAEGALYFGALAFIPSHLHAQYGVSLSQAGSIAMCAGLGALFFSLCAGLFLGLGERRLISVGAVLLASSLLVIAFARHWSLAVPACFCAGLGFYMVHSTFQTRATQLAPARRAAAMAAFSSCFFLGQSAGVALCGRVIEQMNSSSVMVISALGMLGVGFFSGVRGAKARD